MEKKIQTAKNLIAEADVLVIGAAAGLSEAAGLHYGGPRFRQHFSDYMERYGLTDMYSSAFYPFASPEEKWAYWARHIQLNRYGESLPLYRELHELVKDKETFVITTNVDGQFAKAGFDESSLFEVQGNYGEFQCSLPCQQEVFPNQELVEAMLKASQDFKIPSSLIPHCPRCQSPLTTHLRVNETFVETQNWHQQEAAYLAFLQANAEKKIVFLELGVGYNTPTIIKFPFERLNAALPASSLIRLNLEDPEREGIITIQEDIKEVIAAWRN